MWKPAHDSALITRVNKPVKMRISFINCHWKINAAWDEHHTESHARDRNLSALSSDQADETSKGAAGRNKTLYLYMCFVKACCKWKMKMKMYIYISQYVHVYIIYSMYYTLSITISSLKTSICTRICHPCAITFNQSWPTSVPLKNRTASKSRQTYPRWMKTLSVYPVAMLKWVWNCLAVYFLSGLPFSLSSTNNTANKINTNNSTTNV